MRILTTTQLTDEWRMARVGMFSASRAADMLATTQKGGEAAARRDLRLQLALERITGQPQGDDFQNAAMLRGVEKEPAAFDAYEALTGQMAHKVGFVAHDTLMMGASPDGIIGDWEGLLEIKAPKSATHLSYLKEKAIPKEYIAQITHALFVTGAKWASFVSFDDRMPGRLQMFHVRIARDEAVVQAYADKAIAFLKEVDVEVQSIKELQNAV